MSVDLPRLLHHTEEGNEERKDTYGEASLWGSLPTLQMRKQKTLSLSHSSLSESIWIRTLICGLPAFTLGCISRSLLSTVSLGKCCLRWVQNQSKISAQAKREVGSNPSSQRISMKNKWETVSKDSAQGLIQIKGDVIIFDSGRWRQATAACCISLPAPHPPTPPHQESGGPSLLSSGKCWQCSAGFCLCHVPFAFTLETVPQATSTRPHFTGNTPFPSWDLSAARDSGEEGRWGQLASITGWSWSM